MLKNPVIHGALVGLVTISLIGCQAGSSAPSASEKSKTGVTAPQESGSGTQETQKESGSGSH